jgi:ribonuclease P protein component
VRHPLPRERRIRKRAEFLRIQDSPVRVTTRHLLLLLASSHDGGAETPPNPPHVRAPPSSPARLGVVASRKVGPAVARNRAKRLVREAFRLHPEVFPGGVDVVIIVRPGTHLLGLAELAAEVVNAGPMLARRAREIASRRRAASSSGPAAGPGT